jgi:hypothetical protein
VTTLVDTAMFAVQGFDAEEFERPPEESSAPKGKGSKKEKGEKKEKKQKKNREPREERAPSAEPVRFFFVC